MSSDPNPIPSNSEEAVRYWRGNLDPGNLERELAAESAAELERDLRFADTPDVRSALAWIAPDGAPARIVDLGCGLGTHAIHFARLGHRVIAVDSSPERLARLRARAAAAGVADRVSVVAARAESLPFASGTLPGLFTRSVLIHTDLPRAAEEIARCLMPGGRAGLAEPQPGNPFARLYRATLAPRAWRGITFYFTSEMQRETLTRIGGGGDAAGRVEPHYLFSFLAFAFQFALPRPALFRAALALALPADRMLFRLVPPSRRLAWFGLILAERPGVRGDGP